MDVNILYEFLKYRSVIRNQQIIKSHIFRSMAGYENISVTGLCVIPE